MKKQLISRAIKITTAFVVLLPTVAVAVSYEQAQQKTRSGISAVSATVSLHEAVERTLVDNLSLKAFDYQLEAHQGRLLQARLPTNPEMALSVEDVLGSNDFNDLSSAQTTLSISWVLERSLRERRVGVARAGGSLLVMERDIRRLDAAAETARRYLDILAQQAHLETARESIQLARATVKSVERRLAAGKAPEAELARAETELARRELARDGIKYQLKSALRRLSAQWGETIPEFTAASGDLMQFPAIDEFRVLLARLENNRDLTRYLTVDRLHEAELRLAEQQAVPNWRVGAGIRHFESSNDQALVFDFSIPLAWKNKNQGRLAEIRANRSFSAAEAQARKVQLETTLYSVYQQLQHSVQVVNSLKGRIIPRIERALMQTRKAYELGRYSYLEYRTVQTELLEAQSALVEASVAVYRNAIEIERLTGSSLSASEKFRRG